MPDGRLRKGGPWAALSRSQKSLLVELVAIPALVVLVGFLVYHFVVRTIRNPRPLGGVNVLVTAGSDQGSELAFAVGPGRHGVLFGTTDSLIVRSSLDGGRTWQRSAGPRAVCGFGWPRALVAPDGHEILAFLADPDCGDKLRPYLADAASMLLYIYANDDINVVAVTQAVPASFGS